ncbi:hypothetical protein [Luteimonas lutimaris]|uniref:SH3 domain-containing protein n=1 Tax=Luteimonas lutimaris TaxID=698645 RepID=A0ABP7MWJ9_9GAMM
MTRNPLSTTTCALAIGLAFIVAPSLSSAADSRSQYVAATSVCHVVNPAQAAQVRFRHLGVFNMPQGSAVQVACSIPGDYQANTDNGWIRIQARNYRSGPTTMNCTVSGGKRSLGVNNYPDTISLPANDSADKIWQDINKVNAFGHYNIVCILPPNVELSTIWFGEHDTGGLL